MASNPRHKNTPSVPTRLDSEDGKTIQSQQKQSDINVLIDRYRKTGSFTHIAASMPSYGDFTAVPDYLQAQLLIKRAEEHFMEMPSALRDRFGHDPGNLIDFLDNPENEAEARELGLMPGVTDPVTPPTPTPTPETPETPPTAEPAVPE